MDKKMGYDGRQGMDGMKWLGIDQGVVISVCDEKTETVLGLASRSCSFALRYRARAFQSVSGCLALFWLLPSSLFPADPGDGDWLDLPQKTSRLNLQRARQRSVRCGYVVASPL